MPREVMIEFIAPESITGLPPGTRRLQFSVDADEYVKLGTAKIVDEHPPPRSWLLDAYGNLDPGVLAGNQVKQSPAERESEQAYLKSQVAALDRKHEEEAEQRRIKDAVAGKRREVAHE